tara:strand:+ start:303 stop:1700 length:1398 start_codon:yes stop_codon:yes gene_type:complete
MVNWKLKYLEMKLKYINAKQEGGMYRGNASWNAAPEPVTESAAPASVTECLATQVQWEDLGELKPFARDQGYNKSSWNRAMRLYQVQPEQVQSARYVPSWNAAPAQPSGVPSWNATSAQPTPAAQTEAATAPAEQPTVQSEETDNLVKEVQLIGYSKQLNPKSEKAGEPQYLIRIFLLVKVEPYETLSGKIVKYIPYYLSSGYSSREGGLMGIKQRPQPFFGYMASYRQNFVHSGIWEENDFRELIETRPMDMLRLLQQPKMNPNYLEYIDYNNLHRVLAQYTQPDAAIGRLLTSDWMIKCASSRGNIGFNLFSLLKDSTSRKDKKLFEQLREVRYQSLFKEVTEPVDEAKNYPGSDGKICNPYQWLISIHIKEMIENGELNIEIENLQELKPSVVNEIIGINNPYGISLQSIIDDNTKQLHNIITNEGFRVVEDRIISAQSYEYIIAKTSLPHELNIIDALKSM